MITGKLLKNSTYVLIGIGILVCLYQLKNWHFYPWIQILTCLVIPLFSILLTEVARTCKRKHKGNYMDNRYFATAIIPFIIIRTMNWLIPIGDLFFPSLFSILLLTYAVSSKKDEKEIPTLI